VAQRVLGRVRAVGRKRADYFELDFWLQVPFERQPISSHLKVEKISWAVEPLEEHSSQRTC
jgi:hypothetical protein